MAIMAVGDRSLDDLEEDIIDRFAALEARGRVEDSPVDADFALRDEPLVDVLIEPSFGDSFISVDIPLRSWDLNTRGGNELQLTEIMLGIMIDNRLREGVDSGRLNLRRAGGGWFSWNRDLAYLGFNVDADDLEAGTEEFMTELQGSIQNPFSEQELERATEIIRSSQEQQLAQSETRQDGALADQLVNHFLWGGDIQSIEDSVEMVLGMLDGLELDEINNHYGWMMTSSAPIVIVVGPDADRVGDPAVHLAGVERAAQAVVDAFADDVEEIDELVEPPDPIDENSRMGLDRNDGFELVFDNGNRVLFSPSTISEEQVVLVKRISWVGVSMLSEDDGAVAGAAVSAVWSSGVGSWDPIQVRRYLADLEISLSPYIADFSEGFSGGAATGDLDVLFQLLHLSLLETADRRRAVRTTRSSSPAMQSTAPVSTRVPLPTSLWPDARTGGGSLAAVPTEAQLDALTPDDAQRIWEERFGSLDQHVIVVVGDVDPDDVIDLGENVGSGRCHEQRRPISPSNYLDLAASTSDSRSAPEHRVVRIVSSRLEKRTKPSATVCSPM